MYDFVHKYLPIIRQCCAWNVMFNGMSLQLFTEILGDYKS